MEEVVASKTQPLERERGFGFIEHFVIAQYVKLLIFWLLAYFNPRTLTITIDEGKTLTLDLAHICHIYGMKWGTKRVSSYLEHDITETKLWVTKLGLPIGNKGCVTLTELSDCMDVEEDLKKWFEMFVVFYVGCMVKSGSNSNISLSYLGLFNRWDAPYFKELDWPEHILEVIQEFGVKSYADRPHLLHLHLDSQYQLSSIYPLA
ncbi:hypothetical protein LINPERHAP1_LOCUS19644 [Linum perenne]